MKICDFYCNPCANERRSVVGLASMAEGEKSESRARFLYE